jgi:hypothetical protein
MTCRERSTLSSSSSASERRSAKGVDRLRRAYIPNHDGASHRAALLRHRFGRRAVAACVDHKVDALR